MNLLWAWTRQIRLHRLGPAGTQLDHGLRHRTRHIAHFFLHGFNRIKAFVAGRIRLVVADETIKSRLCTSVDESHSVEPVRQRATRSFDSAHITVDDHPVDAPCQVLRIVLAGHLEAFALPGFFAVGSGLPPSVHTRQSIISFNGLGLWHQYTGETMITTWAAVRRSWIPAIQSLVMT